MVFACIPDAQPRLILVAEIDGRYPRMHHAVGRTSVAADIANVNRSIRDTAPHNFKLDIIPAMLKNDDVL